jgi:ABC-type branched-subunit amino acid transport system substrate-binding protein
VAGQQFAIFNKAKVPVISQAGSTIYTDTAKWPYMFGISPSVPQEGMASAKWIAKHTEITKIAVLTDGAPASEDNLNSILTPLKTLAPNVQVVKTVTIPAGSVDVSTAVAQLKAASPDLVMPFVSYGLGPIWQAIQAANWSPRILSTALVWYDGFTGMGSLATNGVAEYYSCVQQDHAPFSKQLTDLLDGYANTFGANSVNYLTYVDNDLGPMELMKAAIEKYHSVDPDAVKAALESTPQTLWGAFTYNYTPTNHWGITSDYAANVCKDAPFSDGAYRLPIVAP